MRGMGKFERSALHTAGMAGKWQCAACPKCVIFRDWDKSIMVFNAAVEDHVNNSEHFESCLTIFKDKKNSRK